MVALHVIPAPPVIPAEAGIHIPLMDPRVKPEDDKKASWIPGSSPRMTKNTVIPAKAGIHEFP